jgi:hypothetical protein
MPAALLLHLPCSLEECGLDGLCILSSVCRDADVEDSMPSSWKDKSGEEKQVTSEAKL